MKPITVLLLLLSTTIFAKAQNLYTKAYGNKDKPAIIFIHGGPSGNSTLFEATTAQTLASKGFYVIVYDRRGEGRSADSNATFTYLEAFADLNTIYKQYHLKKANLIGHSFGGLVATLYTEKYPLKVGSLLLAGALFSQQETYNHILDSVKNIYQAQKDAVMLKKTSAVENLDKNSAGYRKGCYDLADENGFFDMPAPTAGSGKLRQEYAQSIFYKTNIRNKNAPLLFYQNEPLKNIDTKPVLQKIKQEKVNIYAIYGKQDGIFSVSQINDLRNLVSENNFVYLDNCSHYLFVDQQEQFITAVTKWFARR